MINCQMAGLKRQVYMLYKSPEKPKKIQKKGFKGFMTPYF